MKLFFRSIFFVLLLISYSCRNVKGDRRIIGEVLTKSIKKELGKHSSFPEDNSDLDSHSVEQEFDLFNSSASDFNEKKSKKVIIYLMRHLASEANRSKYKNLNKKDNTNNKLKKLKYKIKSGRHNFMKDPPLSDEGLKQAQEVRLHFKKKMHILFTSGLLRAIESAAPFSDDVTKILPMPFLGEMSKKGRKISEKFVFLKPRDNKPSNCKRQRKLMQRNDILKEALKKIDYRFISKDGKEIDNNAYKADMNKFLEFFSEHFEEILRINNVSLHSDGPLRVLVISSSEFLMYSMGIKKTVEEEKSYNGGIVAIPSKYSFDTKKIKFVSRLHSFHHNEKNTEGAQIIFDGFSTKKKF